MPTMRSVSLGRQPGDREIAEFAELAHRPLVIVGNGPSSAFPPRRQIPGDAVVFRMNWFFLESHYYFGRQVDAWFFAVPHQLLEQSLNDEVRLGRYDVDRLMSPMQLASDRDGDRWGHQLLEAGLPEFDHWAVISRHPRLARWFMSRPGLPTTGMQALGFALGVGFREIYLSGIDLYESKEARYSYAVTDKVAAGLLEKDLKPGYESSHSIDTDLGFLRSCLVEFPDAQVTSLSESTNLGLYLPGGVDLVDREGLSEENTPALGRPKERVAFTLPASGRAETMVIPAPHDDRLWSLRDGRKCAYVTVVSGDYHHGARALANSLRAVSDVPLLVLATDDADRGALIASGLHVIDIPGILNPQHSAKHLARFAATYSKLNVFRLDFLDRAVYLDSDTLVLQNIDELFETTGFAAAADAGIDRPNPAVFNSGVFAVDPSYELFSHLMDNLDGTHSYDGGDQGFLNTMISDWTRLDLAYNTTKRISVHHPMSFVREDVKVLHYVGRKPWELDADARYRELDQEWLTQLQPWELRELVSALRYGATDGPSSVATTVGGGKSPFRRAQQLVQQGRYAEVDPMLAEAWSTREPTPAELREAATALSKIGRHAAAVERLQQARTLKPESRKIREELRLAQLRLVRQRVRRAGKRWLV